MKKLKPISMLITSFAVVVACIVPSFSAVKAESLTPMHTGEYGSYIAETYFANSSPLTSFTVGVEGFGVTISNMDSTVFRYHYDFSRPWSGSLTLTINTQYSYALNACDVGIQGGWFQNTGNLTTISTSHTIVIGFINTESIEFVISAKQNSTITNPNPFNNNTTFSASFSMNDSHLTDNEALNGLYDLYYTYFDYKMSDMASTMSDMLQGVNDIESAIHDLDTNENLAKYFPTWNLAGYLWAISYPQFPTYTQSSEIPWVYINTGQNTNAYNNRHRFFVGNGQYTDIYMLSTWWITTDRLKLYHSINDENHELNYTVDVIGRYSSDSNSSYHTVYMHKIRVIAPNIGDEFSFEFTGNVYAYVVYQGFNGQLPDYVADMLQVDYSNTYTTLLDRILQAIRSLGGENLYDTSTYDNAVDDAGDFMDNVVNTMPSVNDVQSDINSLPSFDPTDSNFKLDDMAGFTNYVYVQMTNIFPFLKTFVVLGLIVILMRVFL